MAQVSYVHVEETGSFGFHVGNGELVEVLHSPPYVTDDPGQIAYLDTVPFVKRANGKPKATPDGEEA